MSNARCEFRLSGYNADIICLQEVDKVVYDEQLAPVLLWLGYEGNFCKKDGLIAEGTACFYRSSRFKAVHSERIVISAALLENPFLADLCDIVARDEELMDDIRKRFTTLQLVVLQSICQSNQCVVVANTHLYFHPDAHLVRLVQAAIGLRLAQDLHTKETVGPVA